jgi:MerR HTH family regulatory protein
VAVDAGCAEMTFDVARLPRLVVIANPRRDLGVNLHGIALVLDLLDRLTSLRSELESLRQTAPRGSDPSVTE